MNPNDREAVLARDAAVMTLQKMIDDARSPYLYDKIERDAIMFALTALRAPSPAAGVVVPALEVFRIAGGDVECCPEPTAAEALDCLRDLRECYTEALRAQPAGGGDTVHCPWNDEEGSAPPAFPACRGKSPAPPHWALPAVENALNLLDHYGYIHTDLAAVRDWLKESA